MTTIKLKNGSGAPLAGDLVQGEPALDLTNKRLYTENSSGTVIEVGTNPGEDVTFADNRKAIFGAGSDLQIYHDGTNSYIDDTATGHLFIRSNGDGIYLRSNTNEEIAHFNVNGSVKAYYDNSLKLETTSTGIDVTGTVTADGLTVDGLTQLNTNNLSNGLTISGNDNANVKVRFDNTGASGGDFVIQGGIWGASNQGLSIRDLDNSAQRIHINSGGDISFYEDTGTTAKFFWDSSAESLGIGTSSPSAALDVSYGDYQNSGAIKIGADLGQNTSRTDASRKFGAITAAHFDNDEADLGLITMDSSSASVSALTIGGGSSSFSSASTINFQTSSDGSSAGTNAMTIDASRNVGIGIAPDSNASLHTHRNDTNRLLLSSATNAIQIIGDPSNVGMFIDNQSSTYPDIVFRNTASYSERMRILSSGGITFNGDTAQANALDDYEEGTWTPALSFGGNTTGITYSRQEGKYIKVGNLVYIQCHFLLTSKGTATGQAAITGLPFTPSSTTNGAFSPLGDRGHLNTGGEPVSAYLQSSTTVLLYHSGFDGGENNNVNHGHFETTTEIDFNFCYPT